MSTRPKPACEDIRGWLKANLGKACLAPLTGTDLRALATAAHALQLWSCADSENEPHALAAFREAVLCMQDHTREFAYHAIAWASEWHFRDRVWAQAGLPPITPRMHCQYDR